MLQINCPSLNISNETSAPVYLYFITAKHHKDGMKGAAGVLTPTISISRPVMNTHICLRSSLWTRQRFSKPELCPTPARESTAHTYTHTHERTPASTGGAVRLIHSVHDHVSTVDCVCTCTNGPPHTHTAAVTQRPGISCWHKYIGHPSGSRDWVSQCKSVYRMFFLNYSLDSSGWL